MIQWDRAASRQHTRLLCSVHGGLYVIRRTTSKPYKVYRKNYVEVSLAPSLQPADWSVGRHRCRCPGERVRRIKY